MRSRQSLFWLLLLTLAVSTLPGLLAGPASADPRPGAVRWALAPFVPGATIEVWVVATTGADGRVFVAGVRGRDPDDPYTGQVKITCYAVDGSILWSRDWSGAGIASTAQSIAVDRRGDLYVLATALYGLGPQWPSDIAVLKYSAAGDYRWSRWLGDDFRLENRGVDLEVDGAGNVYVAAALATPGQDLDIAVFKLTSAGDVRYRTMYEGPHMDGPTGLSLDQGKNAYVSGWAGTASGFRPLLMKVAPSGTRAWVRRLDPLDGVCEAVQARAGAIYVAGQDGAPDRIFCARYSPAGEQEWLRTWDSGPGAQWVEGLAVDSRGGAYVIGDVVTVDPTASTPGFLVKWGSGSGLRWIRYGAALFRALGADPHAVLVAPGDRVYIGGRVYDPDSGDADVLVSRYTPAGDRVWKRRWDGADHRWDECMALAYRKRAGATPVLYAAGSSHGTEATDRDPLVLRLQP
jgi:hypothetical protein